MANVLALNKTFYVLKSTTTSYTIPPGLTVISAEVKSFICSDVMLISDEQCILSTSGSFTVDKTADWSEELEELEAIRYVPDIADAQARTSQFAFTCHDYT